jgi:hypothetical protein
MSSLCSGGCPLSLPVLEKSLVSIEVRGDTAGGYLVTALPSSIGSVTSHEACICSDKGGANGSIPQPPTEPCPSGESKGCLVFVDIQTDAAGPVQLSVLDASGGVVDTATFSVEPAKAIQTLVALNGQQAFLGANGAYPVHVGDAIALQSLVTSAGGLGMVYTEHGLIPSYSDSSVVASNPCSDGTDIEDSVAQAPGAASVTMTAAGARASTTFDVTQ